MTLFKKMSRLFCLVTFISIALSSEGLSNLSVKEISTPSLKLKGWIHEDHNVPVVSLVISFRAGGCYAPKKKAGISAVLADMLLEGAGELKTQQFHEILNDLGIELSTQVDPDRLVITMRTPRQHLEKALDLLSLVLHEPRFDHDSFERIKKLSIADETNRSQTPDWIAARQLDKAFYGAHPYSRAIDGTPESLSTINVRDMSKFMKDHFSLDRFRWAISGDITAEVAGQALDKLLTGLPEKGFRRKFTIVKPPQKGARLIKTAPHSQVKILFAHKGIPHSHEDFMMYYLISYVLGGGAEARLMQQIRDDAGLAYYAYASGKTYRYSSSLAGSLGTKGESALQAVEKVKNIFSDIKEKGITKTELEKAKKHLIGRFPMSFTSSRQIATVLHAFQIFRFQPDYLEKREGIIRSLTLEKVNTFAKKFFDPESLIFSLAGSVKEEPEMEAPKTLSLEEGKK